MRPSKSYDTSSDAARHLYHCCRILMTIIRVDRPMLRLPFDREMAGGISTRRIVIFISRFFAEIIPQHLGPVVGVK